MGKELKINPANHAGICDPAKLAAIGASVCNRLAGLKGIQRIATDHADVFVAERFLTKLDCKLIVQAINRLAVPSTLYDGKEKTGFRTSHTHHFERNDPLTRDLEDYICTVTGLDILNAEQMQGQRYQKGQEYRHHHDFFHVGEGYWNSEADRGGQRTWTAMLTLNEPKEGGETDFPHLGFRFQPRAGRLLMWNNMDRSGRPNMKTLHAGMPVIRGIKHVVTLWFRENPWRILNPAA